MTSGVCKVGELSEVALVTLGHRGNMYTQLYYGCRDQYFQRRTQIRSIQTMKIVVWSVADLCGRQNLHVTFIIPH